MSISHGVRVVPLEDVAPIELPGGSWSRVLLTGDRVGSATALGVSSFAPGTATAMLCHEAEELAYVLSGRGELRLEDEAVPYGPGSALYIPAGVPHGWTDIADHVDYLSVRPDPDRVLPAGYVNPALKK